MNKGILSLSVILLAIFSCKTSKNAQLPVKTDSAPSEITASPKEKEPAWLSKNSVYFPSKTRINDLLHTRLEIKFNWDSAWAYGKATLQFRPYFYPTDSLILDAKGFEIKEISVLNGENKKSLIYTYNNSKIQIKLDKTYTRDQEYSIFIEYVAKPNNLKVEGSNAITDAKGLYFINPDGSDPKKPKQIWTQGETESSSCWFPTIDSPNEKTTQEIFITVNDNFKTLSNGRLISSLLNADGTRTDYWKQELPHSPYLFMMAIGEFSIVSDKWRGKEVNYYVEKKYEPFAKLIFGNTPEMLEYYSNVLGVEYPWDKFSQVVVRDFVSGAMENTGAVIHFGLLQHNANEHLDNTYEDVICHELFHHWFGDLVTAESWPNLPLNESFATYGEYLWNENKYGKDEADRHLHGMLTAYLGESRIKREPLIRYYVKDKEDMFDAHSYQKGGRVLHMLRNYVGDEAFFASLKVYLTKNAYKSAEIHDLRLAFEEVTGKDLNWFFNQWFLSPGHPELDIKYTYDGVRKKYAVSVTQKQNLKYLPLFKLPVNIEIVSGGSRTLIPVKLVSKDTVFEFDALIEPEYVVFDSEQMLLARINEDKPRLAWINQLKNGINYRQQSCALEYLSADINDSTIFPVVLEKLKDEFWGIRSEALEALMLSDQKNIEIAIDQVLPLIEKDPKSDVRAAAVALLETPINQESLKVKAVNVLEKAVNDSSYSVSSNALEVLQLLSPEKALLCATKLENTESFQIKNSIARIYKEQNNPKAFDFMMKNLDDAEGFQKITGIQNLKQMMETATPEQKQKGIEYLKKESSGNGIWWMRAMALQVLNDYKDQEDVKTFLDKLKGSEKNPQILEMLKEN